MTSNQRIKETESEIEKALSRHPPPQRSIFPWPVEKTSIEDRRTPDAKKQKSDTDAGEEDDWYRSALGDDALGTFARRTCMRFKEAEARTDTVETAETNRTDLKERQEELGAGVTARTDEDRACKIVASIR